MKFFLSLSKLFEFRRRKLHGLELGLEGSGLGLGLGLEGPGLGLGLASRVLASASRVLASASASKVLASLTSLQICIGLLPKCMIVQVIHVYLDKYY